MKQTIVILAWLCCPLDAAAQIDHAMLAAIAECEAWQASEVADVPSALLADQQPTPMAAIGDALRSINPQGRVFLDIGCGYDCRAGIVAVRDFGAARVLAIEIDPATADSARRYVAHAGLSDRIDVITADASQVEFPAGAVGYAYLFADDLAALRPKIARLDRFASFSHAVPGLSMRQAGDVYVYEKPRPQPQIAAIRSVAVWNGRTYSRPVCRNSRCSMCASIRMQLAGR